MEVTKVANEAHHAFYDRTGVARGNVRFCRRREEKGGIARELGLTHFVDDHLEVLRYLDDVPHRYVLGPAPAAGEDLPIGVTRVETWEAVTAVLFVDGR